MKQNNNLAGHLFHKEREKRKRSISGDDISLQ
jgi:hypothetical protein